jgi:hypothetical protein
MMKRPIFIALIVSHFLTVSAQSEPCKVLLESIAGEYKGKCLNGLANGKGKASGENTYIGNFLDGMPNGKGTMIYSNGDRFKGFWQAGLKHGQGEFEFEANGKRQKLTGYWSEGEYVGTTDPGSPYKITSVSGIPFYSVEQEESDENIIEISIKSAMTDFMPRDLVIVAPSADIIQKGKKTEIRKLFFTSEL